MEADICSIPLFLLYSEVNQRPEPVDLPVWPLKVRAQCLAHAEFQQHHGWLDKRGGLAWLQTQLASMLRRVVETPPRALSPAAYNQQQHEIMKAPDWTWNWRPGSGKPCFIYTCLCNNEKQCFSSTEQIQAWFPWNPTFLLCYIAALYLSWV